MKHWIWQFLIWVDQGCNLLITPFCDGAWADETLSSRAYRMDEKGRPWGRIMRPIIDAIFFFEPQHCYNAFLAERVGRHLPPEARSPLK